MAEFDEKIRNLVVRLQTIRVKMIRAQPFYAVLLMHMKFAIDESTPTFYTDGEHIAFNPYFVEELSDIELQFVLLHEILHVVLGHCNMEQDKYDQELFGVACDIVVNSNILYSWGMDKMYITVLGEEAMHVAPDGREGYLVTVNEVYQQLVASSQRSSSSKGEKGNQKNESISKERSNDEAQENGESNEGNFDDNRGKSGFSIADDHTFWKSEGDKEEDVRWAERMTDATEIANRANELYSNDTATKGCGSIPLAAQRLLKELIESKLDWRTMLENFIQEEVNDYSFSPPDHRFEDSPFFLPDFNEKDVAVKNIVFLVDTSGSITDDMIGAAFSEIQGAIIQFNSKLEGYIAFFDTEVYGPDPICGDTDIAKLIPRGGGGTEFKKSIEYVLNALEEPPECIIFITDGYCNIPEEKVAQGIPFLWLITNNEVTPPWGKVGRILPE